MLSSMPTFSAAAKAHIQVDAARVNAKLELCGNGIFNVGLSADVGKTGKAEIRLPLVKLCASYEVVTDAQDPE